MDFTLTPNVSYPWDVSVIPGLDLVYVIDNGRVVAMDFATGNIWDVTSSRAGSGSSIGSARALAYDPATKTHYLADSGGKKVLSFDPATGDRTVVSSASVGTGTEFSNRMSDLAWDAANNRLFAADNGVLYSVDVSTGNRTEASSATVGTGDNPGFGRINVNAAGTVAYASVWRKISRQPGWHEAFSVDLATGDRTLLSNQSVGSGPAPSTEPTSVLDEANNRMLLTDRGGSRVLALDLSSGVRSVFSSGTVGTGPAMTAPVSITLVDGVVYVGDDAEEGVFSLDADGNRTLLITAATGTGLHFEGPRSVTYDVAGSAAVVGDVRVYQDDSFNTFYDGRLIRVDRTTGDRTVISSAAVGTGPALQNITGVAFDAAGGRVLAVDNKAVTLFSVDLTSGDRTVLSGDGVGAGLAFSAIYDVVVDGDRALVSDSFEGILAVDLSTGDRTLVSGSPVGTGDTISAQGIALDEAGQRLFLGGADASGRGVFSVDLPTGDHTMLLGGSFWKMPYGVAYSSVLDQILVVDTNAHTTATIDPITGTRVKLATISSGVGPDPLTYRDIEVSEAGTGLIADETADALIELDLATGEHWILSK